MDIGQTILAICGVFVGGIVAGIWCWYYFDLERRKIVQDHRSDAKRTPLLTDAGVTCEHSWDKVEGGTISTPSYSKFVCVLHCYKCGSLDKTVESVFECQHKWFEPTDTILESPYEQIRKMFQTVKRGKTQFPKNEVDIPSPRDSKRWIFRKTLLRERICRTCGKLDRVTVSNILEDVEEPERSPEPAAAAEQVD